MRKIKCKFVLARFALLSIVAFAFVSGPVLAAPGSVKVANPSSSPSIAAMRIKFESTPNYAAFIHDGMQRPSEGGRFYAWLAYNRCEELSTVNLTGPAHEKAKADLRDRSIKKLASLKAACNGVKSQFPDQLTFLRALKSSNARGVADVLLVEDSTLAIPRKQTSSKDLARAKMSGDPYAIAVALDMNIEFIAEEIDPAFAQGRNRTTLFMASSAAACEIVGNCVDNLRVLITCVSGGKCENEDLRDSLRQDLSPELRPLYDKTRIALLKSVGR